MAEESQDNGRLAKILTATDMLGGTTEHTVESMELSHESLTIKNDS
jgi:hypothetical protein